MFNVDVDNWETVDQEEDIWLSIIVDGAVTSETRRSRIKTTLQVQSQR